MLNFVRLLNNAILIIFLKRNNINYRFNKAKIKNMVLTIEINKEINLKKLNEILENSDYEPEQFPGLVHHILALNLEKLLLRAVRLQRI